MAPWQCCRVSLNIGVHANFTCPYTPGVAALMARPWATPAHRWPGVRAVSGQLSGLPCSRVTCSLCAPELISLMANVSGCRTHDSRTHGLTCLLGDARQPEDVQPKHLQGRLLLIVLLVRFSLSLRCCQRNTFCSPDMPACLRRMPLQQIAFPEDPYIQLL